MATLCRVRANSLLVSANICYTIVFTPKFSLLNTASHEHGLRFRIVWKGPCLRGLKVAGRKHRTRFSQFVYASGDWNKYPKQISYVNVA